MALYPPLWMQESIYPANLDRFFIQDALGPGPALLGGVGSLQVTQHAAGANMSVDVAPGRALVPGTDVANQGSYSVWSDAVVNVPIATAPGAGQSRIDVIVARVRDDFVIGGGASDFVIVPIPGTAAATGSQVAPAIPNSALALAQVLVGPSVIQIATTNITDVRPFSRGSTSVQTLPPITTASSPYTVTHNLNTTNLSVSLWDTVTNQLIMAQVSILNANQIQISVAQNMPNPVNVVMMGAISTPTPVLASDLAPKAYVDARTPNLPGPVTSGTTIQTFIDALGDVWVALNGVNSGNWKRARDVLHCHYYRGTSFSITTGNTWQLVGYDTRVYDDYVLYVGAGGGAGLITVPVPGMWRFYFMADFTPTATAQWGQVGIWDSTGATVYGSSIHHSASTQHIDPAISVVVRVPSAGTQYSTRLAASGTLTVNNNSNSTYFEASYLGTG
jgi:hypothetical protein